MYVYMYGKDMYAYMYGSIRIDAYMFPKKDGVIAFPIWAHFQI